MTNNQKATELLKAIIKAKEPHEASELRQELDHYLNMIEEQKVRRYLNKHAKEYADQFLFAPTSNW
ncbi:MAG: hypothetical protein NC218_01980 [Acetobacter sp.]|nr:hypothetical protein [Acetobacter sp.]